MYSNYIYIDMFLLISSKQSKFQMYNNSQNDDLSGHEYHHFKVHFQRKLGSYYSTTIKLLQLLSRYQLSRKCHCPLLYLYDINYIGIIRWSVKYRCTPYLISTSLRDSPFSNSSWNFLHGVLSSGALYKEEKSSGKLISFLPDIQWLGRWWLNKNAGQEKKSLVEFDLSLFFFFLLRRWTISIIFGSLFPSALYLWWNIT